MQAIKPIDTKRPITVSLAAKNSSRTPTEIFPYTICWNNQQKKNKQINLDSYKIVPALPLWQISHTWDFSPVWVLICFVNSLDWQNAFWHTQQTYGLSPVWVLTWAMRFELVENALGQMWHLWGFSPENQLIKIC